MTFTHEQIAEMNDANENFYGTTPHFDRIQRYNQIAEMAAEMFDCCDERIVRIDTFAPDRTHRHGVVKLDFRPGLFNGRAKELYQKMINLADEISMDSRFISLFVMDTWS